MQNAPVRSEKPPTSQLVPPRREEQLEECILIVRAKSKTKRFSPRPAFGGTALEEYRFYCSSLPAEQVLSYRLNLPAEQGIVSLFELACRAGYCLIVRACRELIATQKIYPAVIFQQRWTWRLR